MSKYKLIRIIQIIILLPILIVCPKLGQKIWRARKLKKGDRVKVFDHRLYIDDKKTPLSITMKKATVIKIYIEEDDPNRKLTDVRFDYREGISKGHFIWGIRPIIF